MKKIYARKQLIKCTHRLKCFATNAQLWLEIWISTYSSACESAHACYVQNNHGGWAGENGIYYENLKKVIPTGYYILVHFKDIYMAS